MSPKMAFFLIVLVLFAVSSLQGIWRGFAAKEMATYTKQAALANEAFMQCVMSNQDDISKCDELQRKMDEAMKKLREAAEKHGRALNIR